MFIGRVSAAVQADRLALKHIVPELDESVVTGVSSVVIVQCYLRFESTVKRFRRYSEHTLNQYPSSTKVCQQGGLKNSGQCSLQ